MFSLVVSTALLSGCGTPVEGTVVAQSKPEDAPIFVTPVKGALPVRDNIAAYFETTSRIEAQNRVEVLSK